MIDSKGPKSNKSRAPESTFEEAKYLRRLADTGVQVRLKLSDNQEVEGIVEYFDVRFIRLTRAGQPNLFVFKHDIKYLYEVEE